MSLFERLFRRGPSEFAVQINGGAHTLRASTSESLLQAALKQGLPFPHNCRVGGCGECKCRLVSGQVKELTDKSYLLSAQEIQSNVILACQSQPRSDVVIEVALQAQGSAHTVVDTRAHIVSMQPLTHDIVHLVLQTEQAMPHAAGQCAELTVPAHSPHGGERRSYSFASPSKLEGDAHVVDFYIRKVPGGAFTEWLFNDAQVGDTLTISGPHGQFTLRPGSQAMVFVAGGSGLAPIKAMLEEALQGPHSARTAWVFFGARTQADLYALPELDAIQRRWAGRIRFVPVLSAEPEGSAWAGLRGLVTEHLGSQLNMPLSDAQAYLCGPPPMVDACVSELTALGLPPASILSDKFLNKADLARAAA